MHLATNSYDIFIVQIFGMAVRWMVKNKLQTIMLTERLHFPDNVWMFQDIMFVKASLFGSTNPGTVH